MQAGDFLLPLTAPGTAGTFDLATRSGRWVILYFYPKDNTSACTEEARAFSDAKEAFSAAGADIVGVSRDSVGVHRGFCTRNGLSIELVSDRDEELCRRFDVIRMKKMYGRDCRGIVRSTFLISPDGHLAHEWRGVKVPGHAAEVLAKLKQLQAE